MLAGEQGQAAEMVEVAMGKEDEVETFRARSWSCRGTDSLPACLGCRPESMSKPEGADLAVGTVCPDSTVGI